MDTVKGTQQCEHTGVLYLTGDGEIQLDLSFFLINKIIFLFKDRVQFYQIAHLSVFIHICLSDAV